MKKRNEQIETAIRKTGYILELEITNLLEDDGWSIINNRYYIDESTNTQREIDIIAYKTFSYEDIRFFYVLLISCKKSDERDWVLISRPVKGKDVNLEFYPQLIWSNSSILKLTDCEGKLRSFIEEKCKKNDQDFSRIYGLKNRVYAFQEVGISSDRPQNDRSIFSSIDSLIKAAHFEYKSVKKRRKDDVFYHFNLINIFDGNMYEALNNGSAIEVNQIDSANYINRYIVGEEDKFYRIGFFTKELFITKLVEIDNIISNEFDEMKKNVEEFKTNFLNNWEYKQYFSKELLDYIGDYIRTLVTDSVIYRNKVESLYIVRNTIGDGITIEVDLPEENIEAINSHQYVMGQVKKFFKRKCKYEGPIMFGEITYPDDILF